ncbi:type II toxin-antitoxin system RelE/ParE family toxin [Patescibacteria group bacterium]|nr:type II toxin-antitoxin system RelE/ParE family toxin [Patescibacteria group bacterium]
MNVIFFNSKVKDNLYSLDKIPLDKCLRLIDLLKMFGNKLSMPYSKKISTNLYELRIRGQQEVRIFYCFYRDKAVILHHFMKKSQKTPRKEIEVALSRIAVLT